jgi:hypothetical protein
MLSRRATSSSAIEPAVADRTVTHKRNRCACTRLPLCFCSPLSLAHPRFLSRHSLLLFSNVSHAGWSCSATACDPDLAGNGRPSWTRSQAKDCGEELGLQGDPHRVRPVGAWWLVPRRRLVTLRRAIGAIHGDAGGNPFGRSGLVPVLVWNVGPITALDRVPLLGREEVAVAGHVLDSEHFLPPCWSTAFVVRRSAGHKRRGQGWRSHRASDASTGARARNERP